MDSNPLFQAHARWLPPLQGHPLCTKQLLRTVDSDDLVLSSGQQRAEGNVLGFGTAVLFEF